MCGHRVLYLIVIMFVNSLMFNYNLQVTPGSADDAYIVDALWK